jgi:hypothetical protein
MKNFKVLWFDDKFNELENIIEEASLHSIDLVGFTNSTDGLYELKNNLHNYDAVLCDGLFFKYSNQTGDSVKDDALYDVIQSLRDIRRTKYLPWFILSGQDSFILETNRVVDLCGNPKVYSKHEDSEMQILWNDIISGIQEQSDNQLKIIYNDAFEACTDKYIGNVTSKLLLEALQLTNNNEDNLDTESAFNSIRKIIEKLLASFYNLGFIPEEIKKNPGWINQSSLFLSGNHKSYKYNKEILTPSIAFILKNILHIIQDGSHIEGNLHLKVDQHVRDLQTPYLFKSIVFQLLDLLVWYKRFSDHNTDPNKNKLFWESNSLDDNDWIAGKIIKIAENGYGTFQPNNGGKTISILPAKVKEFALEEGQPIKVVTKYSTDGTKLHIDKIKYDERAT